MPKKVLLTGGAGYIGAHTAVELIERGFDIVLLDDFSRSEQRMVDGIKQITGKAVSVYKGNCADRTFLLKLFDKEKFSSVIHFAAYKSVNESVAEPILYYHNNIASMVELLKVMAEFGVNELIFSSSCTVYGQPDHIPVDETAPFKRAESPYGATKQMCERILEDCIASNNLLNAISLRYFNPVGAHPSALIGELPIGVPNNLVPYITQTAAGVRQKLIVFGNDYNTPDGSCLRDFIHVVDLAKAHAAALEKIESLDHRFEAFNLGTGKGVSVLEVVDCFQTATGVKLKYEVGPRRAGDVEKIFADPAKAEKLLGWTTELSLTDSMSHAWQWEKNIRGIK
ncbi:MAG: UDP-glucose 4-epimerase GalE [Bacteroidota bacterium]|jgi:UDP-glucose 4-epimerase|nr:UDP-glucose 4-epimerase GalE [Flammeovirgaceae bacterium]MCZ8068844.1 UDP-glucose 4-epimerase GalE [Cytophagales bacterium]